MNNGMGGDLVAGARIIAKDVEEEGRFDAEREGMSEVLAENEKPSSGGPSSGAGSDTDLKQYDSQIVKVRDRPAGEDDLSHLPEHEQAVLRRQLDVPAVSVGWFSLYRYATTWDKVIVGVSAFGAIGGGAVLPLMTVRLLAESAHPSDPEANVCTGHLWQSFRQSPRLHIRHREPRVIPFPDRRQSPLFYLPRHRRVCPDLRRHGRLHIHG